MTGKITNVFCLLAAFALTVAAVATARNSETIAIGHEATVGGTKLAAGEYLISWTNHSSGADVTFKDVHGKQLVAKARGKIEKRPTLSDQGMVVYKEAPDGSRELAEIRFAGSNKALVFTSVEGGGGAGNSSM